MAGAGAGGEESGSKKWVQAISRGDPRPVSLFASPDSQNHGAEGHSLVVRSPYDVNRESAPGSVCQERNTAMEGDTLLYESPARDNRAAVPRLSPARDKRPPCASSPARAKRHPDTIADSMEQGTPMEGDTVAYHSPVCAKRRPSCAKRSRDCLTRVDRIELTCWVAGAQPSTHLPHAG